MKIFALLLLAMAANADQKQDSYAYILPEKLAVEWNFNGEHRVWLEVRHFNSRDWQEEGFAPNYTEVIVKDYQPRVSKLKDGRWAISFSSPIAADLP